MRTSMVRARRLGHRDLRPAHARLMIYLDWHGSRVSELAMALGVSKNAVGQVVTELEKCGYVERVPDPADGRAKIVRYTAQGHGLLRDALTISADMDDEVGRIIGKDRLDALRDTLAEVCRCLPSVRGEGNEA
ncbi:MarR family transcriptional regulator [Mycolicibacterium sp. (ex Dasyatis americana)]|nr:MarR family transcriptional regulator [Mycolicibacterium sp. (ex Dasyatis americana)]